MLNAPRLQFLLDRFDSEVEEGRLTHRNLLFYILNTLHDLHMAYRADLIEEGVAMPLLNGQASILTPHAAEVRELLAGSTGYQPSFRAFIEASLP